MSVPLAVPTDEGHEKTGPGFLFPIQKSEGTPTGSVDESVFGQVADGVQGALTNSILETPGKCGCAVARASNDPTPVDGTVELLARTVNILLSWKNQSRKK